MSVAFAGVDIGALREVRSGLLAQRRLRGRRFCDVYTDAVDEWLGELFGEVTKDRGPTGIALVAVGGYGRRELCPGSDLDLVLLHDGVRDIAQIADALWYPIWDSGLQLDHSVRSPRDTIEIARGDLKAALGLLSVRHVAGESALTESVATAVRADWSSKAKERLAALRAAMEERWAQHGELAFLLEPEIKLARGGLRDIEALHVAALATPAVAQVLDDPKLETAHEELLAVRIALHATTERRSDLLTLTSQDAVARKLGYEDAEELLPQVASAARRITWATDQVWRRIDSLMAGPRRGGQPRPLDAGLVMRDDEIDLDSAVDMGADSEMALRLAAASARTGLPLSARALARLESEAAPPPEPWPAPTRDALVDLLGCGHAAVPVLETLDHLGVLGRYVREWTAVRSRPQRNAYHRYTVDRHLCEAAAEAAALTRAVGRPDLLLIAAWLHDIGKGFPGDHTEVGVRLVSDIGSRMGFSDEDVAVLCRLVDNHLLLAETATRRDLDDPATIARVLERVPSQLELELLAALTQADSIATGVLAWSAWKAQLVDDLVQRVSAELAGETAETAAPLPTPEHRTLMAGGQLRVVPEGSRLTVVAPDRPGLLAVVSGALAVNGLSVRSAMLASEDGMAVEVFEIDRTNRDEPNWARLERELAAAIADPGGLEVRLAERARSGALPRRPGAARLAPPRVHVDNTVTPRATIVEVRLPDAVGLLSRIAGALSSCGCDITFARVLTFGHEVVDTFYVIDTETGQKVTDTERVTHLQHVILERVAGAGADR